MGIPAGYVSGQVIQAVPSLSAYAVTSSTRPATPFDGQIISETDTDTLQIYKGSAWGNPSGLVLVKTQTIGSAVSSVTVSDAFSATYDAYKIVVTGGSGSGNDNINMTLGSTTTGYYWSMVTAGFDATGPYASGGANTSSWGGIGVVQASTTIAVNVDVLSPYLSEYTSYFGQRSSYVAGSGGAIAGFQASTTSFTAFTLSSSVTMTGGTIRVYGYANS